MTRGDLLRLPRSSAQRDSARGTPRLRDSPPPRRRPSPRPRSRRGARVCRETCPRRGFAEHPPRPPGQAVRRSRRGRRRHRGWVVCRLRLVPAPVLRRRERRRVTVFRGVADDLGPISLSSRSTSPMSPSPTCPEHPGDRREPRDRRRPRRGRRPRRRVARPGAGLRQSPAQEPVVRVGGHGIRHEQHHVDHGHEQSSSTTGLSTTGSSSSTWPSSSHSTSSGTGTSR